MGRSRGMGSGRVKRARGRVRREGEAGACRAGRAAAAEVELLDDGMFSLAVDNN
jgi:hypothetical protein